MLPLTLDNAGVGPRCIIKGKQQGTIAMQTPGPPPDPQDYEQVFEQYLDICNRAIAHNKDRHPYSEIWGARMRLLEKEADIQAVLYDDRPKLSYMLRLTREMKIEIVEKTAIAHDAAWPFTYKYLKRVVDNPHEYIENPAKLEWGWLKAIFASHPDLHSI